jgi:hypothetical protein
MALPVIHVAILKKGCSWVEKPRYPAAADFRPEFAK